MSKEKWVWMPHPGHFIGAPDCQFRLNTAVAGGKYIVSTVGEYVSRYHAGEFTDIGLSRKYETMVFAGTQEKGSCCPHRQDSGSNIDMEGYNTPEDAYKGHLKLCNKWDKKKVSK